MRVDFRNHIDLRMAGVALCSLQIAVVQLELVGRAAVTQRVEYHIGKISGGLKLFERFVDDGFLAGASVR